MGLLQSVASLAQPTSNTVRPSDILMAGQQAQSNLKEGLGGIAGMMAAERKQTAQERADSAVAGLLSNAPKGTQDPTQFNQMLGMASTYGSQQMKDTARNAIESAREGYKNAAQQEQFGQTLGLQRDQLTELTRSNSAREALEGTRITNEKDYQDKKLILDNKIADNNHKVALGQLSVAKANAANNRLLSQFNMDVQKMAAENSGAIFGDPKNPFKITGQDINSPKVLQSYASQLLGEYDKEFGVSAIPKTAMTMGEMNSGWNPFGNLWATQKGQAAEIVSRSAQAQQLLPLAIQQTLGTKGATKQDINNVVQTFKSFVQTGKVDSEFAKKYKLID